MEASPEAEECGTSTDTRKAQRKADYRQLSRIQGKLLWQKEYPLFDDAKLAEVFIARGAPFDVDQNDPIGS